MSLSITYWSACVLFLPLTLFAETLDLRGRWRFLADPEDVGLTRAWWQQRLPGRVRLPGNLSAQGVGEPVGTNTPWTGSIFDRSWFDAPEYEAYRRPGQIKVPFWLQPERYYVGAAWYQRDFWIPDRWQGRWGRLILERPHWETRVWFNNRLLGTNRSLSTPHEYDLGFLPTGRHTLTIRVDNRRIVDIGENSHAISDHTQGNWHGIVGRIELQTLPPVWIEELQLYPRVTDRSAWTELVLTNPAGRAFEGSVTFKSVWRSKDDSVRVTVPVQFNARQWIVRTHIPLGAEAPLWDEFQPALLHLEARLVGQLEGQQIQHRRSIRFGLREITNAGTQFILNGRPLFIRGTLECAIFPRTGHPPTDVAEWRRIIRVAQAHGLNLFRFHSWCPPQAAFEAADELGFYLQVETCWPNQSTTLGDGKPVDAWSWDETERILRAYGNHPSFLFMAQGNEPGGRNASAYLRHYVSYFKARDPRRLWTSASGWPELRENQFHVIAAPRIQAWGAGLTSRINAQPPETLTDYRDIIAQRAVPVISHEIGQWCVYPNLAERRKYTGYLKARNFDIFEDRLKASGLDELAQDFLHASGRLQVLCYKEEIETALRTPGMGGFHLLDLRDFPGQGTALVGVLDPFWAEKGYVTAAEYRRFCNATVPLVRLPRRVFTTRDSLTAQVEVAHFGVAALQEVHVEARLQDRHGRILQRERWTRTELPLGNGQILGTVHWPLQSVPAPARYQLAVAISGRPASTGAARSRVRFENDWDLWVYPSDPSPVPASIWMTNRWDATLASRLMSGERVLLTLPGANLRNFEQAPVKLGFSSIFWNTAWTRRQAPTTLGILCDPRHPALAEFPTETHSNWQWWYILRRAGALRLDLLPKETQPIVRIIDDWFTARSLGLIVEGRVGHGRIVICGVDLLEGTQDPVSQQLRLSLARYLASDRCQPSAEFTPEQIQALIDEPSRTSPLPSRIHASSHQPGYEAPHAVDGDSASS
ncbi:MAG: glycoside hydrolase family 2 TIM barrel-domain containing protein [Verrucomicrobiota bacterium]|nr:hypothetical protein [Limisphaera sp.]MDW8380851.1 glycoside hydrolase family 2 TIM barrel-domain containing protein [Verrucomicrobiota bacterium]